MTRLLLLLAGLSVTACTIPPGNAVMVDTKSPANAQSRNSEPQPPGSLPPSAGGLVTGWNAFYPNFGSLTFPTPF